MSTRRQDVGTGEDEEARCPCCEVLGLCDCEIVTLTGDDRETGPYSNTGCTVHERAV